MVTLHTILGMRILCMPKNLQRKSRVKDKNEKAAIFIPQTYVCVGEGGGGKPHTLHTGNILREITKKIKENHIFSCYTRRLLLIPCMVCAYFAYRKTYKGNDGRKLHTYSSNHAWYAHTLHTEKFTKEITNKI